MENKGSRPQKPTFGGKNGRACEVFIQNVRAYAFSQGKQRDSAWMADFSSTCLSGAAARWFTGLEPDVQGDWPLLSKALLEQYPTRKRPWSLFSRAVLLSEATEAIPPDSIALPTPAAAPPLAAPHQPSAGLAYNESASTASGGFMAPSAISVGNAPGISSIAAAPHPGPIKIVPIPAPIQASRVGRIKLILGTDDSPPTEKYVRRPMNRLGLIKYTDIISDALHVSYRPSTQPDVFKMVNGPDSYTYLGVSWWSKDPPTLRTGSPLWASVTPVITTPESKIFTSESNAGISGGNIWTVGPDETIRATWTDGSKLEMIATKDCLHVVVDLQAYCKTYGVPKTVRWVFEEI